MPHWVKNLMVSVYGLKDHIKGNGKYYLLYYQQLSKLQTNGHSNIEAYQKNRLKTLLQESMQYSTYYKKLFDTQNINQVDISAGSANKILNKLPYLEKENLRQYNREICSADKSRPAVGIIHTSGTTGAPMSIEYDSQSKQGTKAEWRRYYDWMGLPKKFKSVRFSGRIIVDPNTKKAPFWVYNIVNKQLFMSTYHLSEDNISSYIEKLNHYKPEFLDGYPSAFHILAQYILANNIKLKFKPLAISTTAETLFDHHRVTIEKAFGCKVYNQYASSEGAPWIVECKLGVPHLWIDTGVFEFIDQSDNHDGTVNSELVVTSFRNFKTPLIRYRIGDVICRYKDEKKKCACGSSYPMIKSIIGRQDDILFTKDKGHIGRLDPAYKGLTGIRQSKIIQKTIDTIDVLIVADKNFTAEIGKKLLQNIHDRVGVNVSITLLKVDSIPLGKNGKFKSVERQFKLESKEL